MHKSRLVPMRDAKCMNVTDMMLMFAHAIAGVSTTCCFYELLCDFKCSCLEQMNFPMPTALITNIFMFATSMNSFLMSSELNLVCSTLAL